MEVLLSYFPHGGSFVSLVSTLWKFCYHSFHIVEVFLAYFPHCGSFVSILSILWRFCYYTFHIVEVLLAYFPHCGSFLSKLSALWKFLLEYFPHCGSFVSKQIPLSTLWIISHNAFHILEDITVFQAFLPQNCFTYITFTIHIIDHSGYFFHIFNLSLQIYRDFHKSFRNLPKFFREHARGARAIFHLCKFGH